jgi:hypothetical protein
MRSTEDQARIGATGGASPALVFGTNDAERMRITSTGNVGIGTSSPTNPLTVIGSATIGTTTAAPITTELHVHKNAAGADISFGDESTVVISTNSTGAGNQGYIGSLWFGSQDISSVDQYGWKMAGMAGYMSGDTSATGGSADLLFYTANASQTGTERMRIDSSGNVLVGTTDNNPGNDGSGDGGIAIRADGILSVAAASSQSAIFNRIGTDGDIALFRMDGTTVGSIGTKVSSTYIGTGDTGLLFWNAENAVTPYDTGNTVTNGTIDLGVPNYKFKDLYLSGGVYLGGTVAANLLDDYEGRHLDTCNC